MYDMIQMYYTPVIFVVFCQQKLQFPRFLSFLKCLRKQQIKDLEHVDNEDLIFIAYIIAKRKRDMKNTYIYLPVSACGFQARKR